MQTSSKVASAKKVGLLAGLFAGLLNPKMENGISEPHEPISGRGHYFESKGAIEHSYQCRSSQSKRRKLARRVG